MKKIYSLILTLIMALGICFSAFASPNPMDLSSREVNDKTKNGYIDFRQFESVEGLDVSKRPTAAFTVSIGGKGVPAASGKSLDMAAPNIELAGDQTATITDDSSSCMSGNISIWDFQYRVVPKGQDRKSISINSHDYPYYSSWEEVKSAFQEAIKEMKQAGDGAELELYLCVAESYAGADNWSDNGNSACPKVDSIFPNGLIWYFSSMVVDYKTSSGVDLAVEFVPPEDETCYMVEGQKEIDLQAYVRAYRLDAGTTDVPATLTITKPDGSADTYDLTCIPGYEETFLVSYTITEGGQYVFHAQIEPIGVTDKDLANNEADKTIIVSVVPMPERSESDDDLQIGLIHG